MSANHKQIIKFKPIYKEKIWGCNLLQKKFDFDIPSDKTGEAWVISAHKDGDCCIENGDLKGLSLSECWKKHPHLFGKTNFEEFPLLLKYISTSDDLSIQVHPDNKYAQITEGENFGKKECWLVLDCKEGSSIVVGHKAKSKDEFLEYMDSNQWDKILNEIPIKPGDFFQINPGTIHAIQKDTIILETQQSSDLTYRVYDYNRLQDGKPRPLHIKKALDVINFDSLSLKAEDVPNFSNPKETVTEIIKCDEYVVKLINISDPTSFTQDKNFICCAVIDGQGKINDESIQRGDNFILPYKFGDFSLSGNLKIIFAYIS